MMYGSKPSTKKEGREMPHPDYVPGVLLGTGIGDALGMPFEARGCDVHPMLEKWTGKQFYPGTYHKVAAGHWTDDTEMSIALAQSIITEGKFHGEQVARAYVNWFEANPTGMGGSTRAALQRLSDLGTGERWDSLWDANGTMFDDREAVGSGTAMRAAPLGVLCYSRPDMLRRMCRVDAFITHADMEAYAASLAIASATLGIILICAEGDLSRAFVENFVQGQMVTVKDTLVYEGVKLAIAHRDETPKYFCDAHAGRWGNAWQIVATSLYCIFRGWRHSFEDTVEMAIKMGGDADTRGAIVGALKGAQLGISRIEPYYRENVLDGEGLVHLDQELWALGQGRE